MISLLPHTLQNAADQNPDQQAFRFGDRSLTYAQMVRKTNQLAHLLLESGAKVGDRVGVYLNRSLETAIAIYGIMQAGGAYVPLDPHAPTTRTRFILKDCDIRYLITNASQQRKLPDILAKPSQLCQVIGVEGEESVPNVSWEVIDHYPTENPSVRINEHDLAYIMYTSGSTGPPKGIMHTHYSGLSYAMLSADLYGLREQDRIGSHAPLHFDISTLAYFTATLACATSVIISDAHTKMPASLTQLVQAERLTVWYSAPLALIQMLTHGVLKDRDLSSLRWVLYGGEPFPPKYLKTLMQKWSQARFCNVYGPAEVNQCTYYHLSVPPEDDHPIPLGKVWKNTEMLIIDELDQPVQLGKPGELLIRSPTMMKGYWRQPELTQRSFYTRRVIPGQEQVFYRTGDLVSQNADGNLMFLGRKDRQIKTRGYRVELEMVEASLATLDAVAEAAVFPVSHETEGLLIEAAIILTAAAKVTVEEIQSQLAEQLPTYAVPRSIYLVKSLPRTSTGKINHLLLQQYVSKVTDV